MDAIDFAAFANALIERLQRAEVLCGSGAADCRSAISRAYYAAFLTARDLLVFIGFKVTEAGACHDAVYKSLNNSGDADLQAAASKLSTLATERRAADYKLKDLRTEKISQASLMVKMANEGVAKISGFLTACGADAARKTRVFEAILHWATISGQTGNISKA